MPLPLVTYSEVKRKVEKDESHRSNKGLRFLSSKVKDIVSREQCTSYKQMAERLIEEMG